MCASTVAQQKARGEEIGGVLQQEEREMGKYK